MFKYLWTVSLFFKSFSVGFGNAPTDEVTDLTSFVDQAYEPDTRSGELASPVNDFLKNDREFYIVVDAEDRGAESSSTLP